MYIYFVRPNPHLIRWREDFENSTYLYPLSINNDLPLSIWKACKMWTKIIIIVYPYCLSKVRQRTTGRGRLYGKKLAWELPMFCIVCCKHGKTSRLREQLACGTEPPREVPINQNSSLTHTQQCLSQILVQITILMFS